MREEIILGRSRCEEAPQVVPACPCLAHILAYLALILAWPTNIGCQVWLGISKGRVIKEFSEDSQRQMHPLPIFPACAAHQKKRKTGGL